MSSAGSSDEPTRTTRVRRGLPGGVRTDRRPHHLGIAINRAVDQDAGHGDVGPGVTRPAGLAVTELRDVNQLQARFNDDRGVPRLVLALAPT